jgi:hypothetical protein
MPDIVCVGVTTRLREDVISIWNNDNSNPNTRFVIGEKLRSLLNLDETTNVEYKTFRSSIKDKSSFKNARGYGYAPQGNNPQQDGQQPPQNYNNSQQRPYNNNNNGANRPYNNNNNNNYQGNNNNRPYNNNRQSNTNSQQRQNNNNNPAPKKTEEFSLPTVFVETPKDTKA